MASSKVFAGSRLRRLRNQLGLSQLAFAGELGISPSYLNLMERDQRPLTAQVVLKLSGMEGVDIATLAAGEAAHGLLQPLREMVADPLLAGEVPPGNELSEALQAAPNFAAAALKLFTAYREMQKRLADAARGLPPPSREEGVEAFLARRGAEDVEGLAEDIHGALSPKDDMFGALRARLRASHGIDVRVMPEAIIGTDRSRYDRHSQRLFVAEALDFQHRIYEAAHLLARLEGRELIAAAAAQFSDKPDHQRAVTAALRDHLALALLAPRGRFTTAADEGKDDALTLARRFSIGPAQAMLRLAQLREGVSYLCLAANGQILQVQGKLPFHLPQDTPLCGQLPLFEDGARVVVMKPVEGPAFTCSVMLEGALRHGLFTPARADVAQRPFGPACRLCDQPHCARRTAASATRPAGLNDYHRALTDFEPL